MERKLKNSEKTKKKIQSSIIELLNQREYEKISVVDISAAAEISRTTFYLFYSSKDELIRDIFDLLLCEYMETFVQSLRIHEEVPLAIYEKAFKDLIRYEHTLKTLFNLNFQGFSPYLVMEKSIQKAVLDFFVKNGYTMKYGGSIELLSSIYAADVMATVKWWIYNYKEYDILFIKNMIFDNNHKGLFSLLRKV